jgi:hypothetical protein
MFPYLGLLVYVAALSSFHGGILTPDSQAGWIDPGTLIAAAFPFMQSTSSEEVVK